MCDFIEKSTFTWAVEYSEAMYTRGRLSQEESAIETI